MKNKILISIALIFSVIPLHANENITEQVKNIFKNEKLFTNTNLKEVSIYGYTTNINYETALKKLKTSLGSKWKEDSSAEEQTKKILKESGQEMNGMTMFTNNDQMISITHMNLELEGNKFLLQITIHSKKK